jgi:hypothetical protein
MKALILYIVFVAIGAVASALVGLFIERQVSTAISLVIFLTMFFANFGLSWLATVLVMDGSLKNLHGLDEQLAIEKAGRQYATEHRS